MSTTNKCLRLAIKPEQGNGWSEIDGAQWVWCEARTGLFRVFTAEAQPVQLVTDARTGKTYRIASRQGPAGSGVEERFVDRFGEYGGGFEIPWDLDLREHVGSMENYRLRFLNSHVFTRPQDERKANTVGYDAKGYRLAQKLSLTVFKDSEEVEAGRKTGLPVPNEIAYGEPLDGHRFKTRLSGTASELRVTGFINSYKELQQRGIPNERLSDSDFYQDEWSLPVAWLTRYDYAINRATASAIVGSLFGTTTGPDGESHSAAIFGPASSLVSSMAAPLINDLTVNFWISTFMGTIQIVSIGSLGIRVLVAGSVHTLEINDNGTIYTQVLPYDGVGWAHVALVRSGAEWLIYCNGQGITRIPILGMINNFPASLTMSAGNVKLLYDFRAFAYAISAEAMAEYYQNVTERGGGSYIP